MFSFSSAGRATSRIRPCGGAGNLRESREGTIGGSRYPPVPVTDLRSLSHPGLPFGGLDAPGKRAPGRRELRASPPPTTGPGSFAGQRRRYPPFQSVCLDSPTLCFDSTKPFLSAAPSSSPYPPAHSVYCLKSAPDEAVWGGNEDLWWIFPGNRL